MEGDPVENGHEEERPMATTLGDAHVTIVVDGEKNVSDLGEVGQSGADLGHVGLLHEEECHARSEEDDAGLGVLGEGLAL